MSKKGDVYYNGILAGLLEKHSGGYTFTYNEAYLTDISLPPISINFPKSKKEFHAKILFPYFFGLLAEGVNKQMQCKTLKLDEKDHFTRLLKTANINTIGAITVAEDS